MHIEHIEIEKMLFGDYRVQVCDKNLNSMLDREYFCRGFGSAILTAENIKNIKKFENLPIYFRNMDNVKLLTP